MSKEAGEVEPGDIFVLDAVRVQSVMTEGDSTYIAWRGDRRLVDIVGTKELVPDVLSHRCPECGAPIVDDEWKPA